MDNATETFRMRVTPMWLATLDEWRRLQTDIPSRAEAVRRLVDTGMAHPKNPALIDLIMEKIVGKKTEATRQKGTPT